MDLIDTYEKLERALDKLSLKDLRQVCRAVGVECPVRYKIDEMIAELKKVANGAAHGESKISPSDLTVGGDVAEAVLKFNAENK